MNQITALILSVLIEAVIAAALVTLWRAGDARRAALAATLATLVTHWAAWWGVSSLEGSLGYLPAVVVVEACVVLAESVAYRLIVPLRLPRALVVSLVANAASAGVGLALYALDLP